MTAPDSAHTVSHRLSPPAGGGGREDVREMPQVPGIFLNAGYQPGWLKARAGKPTRDMRISFQGLPSVQDSSLGRADGRVGKLKHPSQP